MTSTDTPFIQVLYSGGWIPTAERIRVARRPLFVGRFPEHAHRLVLRSDPSLSREHASFELEDGGVRVYDRESRNGIRVNGASVADRPLRDNDIVRLGDTLLQLRYDSYREDALKLPSLPGWAPSIRRLRRAVVEFGPSSEGVLISAEDGSEVLQIARALHQLRRPEGAFEVLNCASLPDQEIERRLFGARSASFAFEDDVQQGLLGRASGGTLLLMEITSLHPRAQLKLVEVIENGAYSPLGSDDLQDCDVRFVLSSCDHVLGAVRQARLRQDLFSHFEQRLLQIDPLRTRREDILPFLVGFLGPAAPPIGPDLAEALLLHPWPRNMQELRELAVELLGRGDKLDMLRLELIQDKLAQI